MYRVLIFFLILFCLVSVNAEELSWQAIAQKTYNISNSYQKAKARELMGAYKQSVEAYTYTIQEANALLRNRSMKKEQILEILPYTIASAYRLSVANEKMINGRMVYLYEQLERYTSVEDLITDTLTAVSNLRIDNNVEIPVQYYSHLYYSRALNSLGMSYALANGILWKKYLVYMPSDIVMILDNVNTDLQHYKFLNGVTTSGNIQEEINKSVDAIGSNSNLDITLQLSYYIDNKEDLRKALLDRFNKGVLVFTERYANNKEFLRGVANLKTYEEFESNENSRRFIAEIKNSLELLKQY